MVATTRDPSRRRRGALTAAVLIMLMASGAAMDALSDHGGVWRLIDYVRLSAIGLLALVVSIRSTTNFSFAKRVPALDDELTRSNRASAATWGYWGFFLASVAAFAMSLTLDVTLQELAPAVLVCGAAFAGLRFVFLERRGE